MRLDHLMSQKYGFTRNKSQQLIKNGLISIHGIVHTKTAFEVTEEDILEIREDKSITWVSRSAGKLDGFFEALKWINIDIHIYGTHCLDIGSSTGGFTQVLLERWALHIDAVDVGSDQLHTTIRNNKKVSSYEKMDIRNFTLPHETYDSITVDVSFISLREILPELSRFSNEGTQIFLLFKPQFEVWRENLRKTGVPKNEKIIENSLTEFETLLRKYKYTIVYKAKASVIGEAGNQEWIFFVKKYEKMLDV